ncbi:DUF6216 family protein [Luteimonas sp. XNQY3]|nr:DUF6216 family protein [Luteimonas sp. XNQY3]MCD9008224.1 DUF6216 family protein [Luteimonas sp. XNQY3]
MEFDLATILSTSRYAAVLIPAIVVAAFFLVIYRSGSTYPILAGLWQITAGKRVIANETIASYVQGQHDLASFKYFSRVGAMTVDEATKVIAWSNRNNIAVPMIESCGKHFDIEHLRIDLSSLPSRRRQLLWVAMAFAFLIMIGLSMYATLSMRSAYMSFRDDGQRFVVTAEGARTVDNSFRFWAHSQGLLSLESCKAIAPDAVVAGTSFSPTQTRLLCDAFGTDELRRKVDEGITAQKILTLSFAVLFLLAFWTFGSRLHRASVARRLISKLDKREAARNDNHDAPGNIAEAAPH